MRLDLDLSFLPYDPYMIHIYIYMIHMCFIVFLFYSVLKFILQRYNNNYNNNHHDCWFAGIMLVMFTAPQ